jgi:hypothetical protein
MPLNTQGGACYHSLRWLLRHKEIRSIPYKKASQQVVVGISNMRTGSLQTKIHVFQGAKAPSPLRPPNLKSSLPTLQMGPMTRCKKECSYYINILAILIH